MTIVLLCLALLAVPAAAASPSMVELYFELDARVATPALDATVRAAARLAMEVEPAEGGGARLSLVEPLAPAWKFYAVDPAGPLGEEAKLAAVVTLGEPSWEELARRREEVDRLGQEQYRRWVGGGAPSQPFDGSFAFVVIGPPRGRFTVELARSGRMARAEDRLTDRWLPGDLDPLLAAWRRAEASKQAPPRGYWFWNHGEPRPFAWEPHTYHALAAALELLALPLFPDDDAERAASLGAGGGYSLVLERVAESARRVLETLTPKASGKLAGAGGGSARFTVASATATEPRRRRELRRGARGSGLEGRAPALLAARRLRSRRAPHASRRGRGEARLRLRRASRSSLVFARRVRIALPPVLRNRARKHADVLRARVARKAHERRARGESARSRSHFLDEISQRTSTSSIATPLDVAAHCAECAKSD